MKIYRSFVLLLVAVLMLGLGFVPANAQAGVAALCSGIQLQNKGAETADVSMSFYRQGDNDSVAEYVYTVPGGLVANASKSYYVPSAFSTLPSGQYAVVVASSQPLNSLVNQVNCAGAVPAVGASFSGADSAGVGTEVFLPYVLSRAFVAKWSSTVAIQNAGMGTATNTVIQFFAPGSSTPVHSFTNNNLMAGETWYLDLSAGTYAVAQLNGFSGSAKITSDQPVAAITNYAPLNGTRLLSYNSVLTKSQKIYATQVNKNFAADNFTSGITVYNPNPTDTPIAVKLYVSGSSTPICTINDTILANASYVKYLGSVSACTVGSLPAGFNGYAVVEVTSGTNGIMGIFNFDSTTGYAGAATMIPIEDGSTTLYFPQIVRAFGGYESGWQIVNTTGTDLNLTIEYWRDDNTKTFTDHKPLAQNSSLTNFVGSAAFASSLGTNWNGGVKIIVDGNAGEIVGQANFVKFGVTADTLLIYNGFLP